MLVESGELNERAVDMDTFPAVEFDDYLVDQKQDIVIRLLQCLSDSIRFALVRPGVVGLSLSPAQSQRGYYAHA